MGIYRMYTGPDNETHIEELPLSAHPELGELQTVKGLQIQQNQSGRFMDFSPSAQQEVVDHSRGGTGDRAWRWHSAQVRPR